jgi:hypothetical protein
MSQQGSVAVPFTGAREQMAPMSFGQRAIWKSIRWLDDASSYFNIRRVVELPHGLTLDRVLDVVGETLSRNEALRSNFREIDTGPVQIVRASGSLVVHIEHAEEDARERADQLSLELASSAFAHEREWPVRCAVVVRDGAPAWLSLAFSHLAVDFWGVRLVLEELSDRLAGKPVEPSAWQPLDQAVFETEGAGAARAGASIDYWRRTLQAVPLSMFPAVDEEPHDGRFVRLGINSVAAAVAATRIADRCGVSTSTVLLAASAAVLAAETGHDDVAMLLIAVNRHDARGRKLVGAKTANALFGINLEAESFDEFVRKTFLAGMNAYRHAQYDPLVLDEVLAATRDQHGRAPSLLSFFNDKRMSDRWEVLPDAETTDDLRALSARSTVSFIGDWPRQDAKFFVHTTYAPDTCLLYLMVDTVLVPTSRADRLLRAMESLLVENAIDPREAWLPERLAKLTDEEAIVDLRPAVPAV